MIWLKRLLPLVVIVLGYFAWTWYAKSREASAMAEDTHRAMVTAQIWAASATYRTDPQRFLAYRDSLLQANNITTDQMFRYLEVFESDVNRQLRFSQLVSKALDSMARAAEAARRVRTPQPEEIQNSLLPPKDSLK